MQPTGGTISVRTDANTMFSTDRHQQDGFTDIVQGDEVEARGSFDITTQSLIAWAVELDGHGD